MISLMCVRSVPFSLLGTASWSWMENQKPTAPAGFGKQKQNPRFRSGRVTTAAWDNAGEQNKTLWKSKFQLPKHAVPVLLIETETPAHGTNERTNEFRRESDHGKMTNSITFRYAKIIGTCDDDAAKTQNPMNIKKRIPQKWSPRQAYRRV